MCSIITDVARKGRELEELVASIEENLSRFGITVKSPDYIPDKDTGQLREIDVSLRSSIGSSEILVIVECRDRHAEQDVTWIEQVAAKRESVGADKAVVVSSSGFYEPVAIKAKAKNIELRNFNEINPIEIMSWFNCNEGFIISHSYNIKNILFVLSNGTSIDATSMEKFDDSSPILYRKIDRSKRNIKDVLNSISNVVSKHLPEDGNKIMKILEINYTNEKDRLRLVDHDSADIVKILIQAEISRNVRRVPLMNTRVYKSSENIYAQTAGFEVELFNKPYHLEFIKIDSTQKLLVKLTPKGHDENVLVNIHVIDVTEPNITNVEKK